MNKMNTKSVSMLFCYITEKILIPRLNDTEKISQYQEFIQNKDVVFSECDKIIKNLRNRFNKVSESNLEDFIGNVLLTTIKESSNTYLHSRYGFWAKTFDIHGCSGVKELIRTFSYYMYKSVQSEVGIMNYHLKKHEVSLIEDESGNSVLDILPDLRENDLYSKHLEFEEKFEKMISKARNYKGFDDLDKNILEKWIKLRDNEHFDGRINMLKEIFLPIIAELKQDGNKITSSALHFRWKKIRSWLKEFILEAA